jgi:LuxR family maltose regulon positive regulatory protein
MRSCSLSAMSLHPERSITLHRRAADWFTFHGQVVNAIRRTQAAGDRAGAARLLADHSFA